MPRAKFECPYVNRYGQRCGHRCVYKEGCYKHRKFKNPLIQQTRNETLQKYYGTPEQMKEINMKRIEEKKKAESLAQTSEKPEITNGSGQNDGSSSESDEEVPKSGIDLKCDEALSKYIGILDEFDIIDQPLKFLENEKSEEASDSDSEFSSDGSYSSTYSEIDGSSDNEPKAKSGKEELIFESDK